LYALLQPEPAAEPVGESKEEEKPAAVTAPTTDATTASATTATATTAAATDAEAGEVVTGKSGLSETVSAAVVQEVNAVAEKVRLLNGCSTAPDTRVCLRSSSSESIAVFSKQLLLREDCCDRSQRRSAAQRTSSSWYLLSSQHHTTPLTPLY
jgi:hypothetical protein